MFCKRRKIKFCCPFGSVPRYRKTSLARLVIHTFSSSMSLVGMRSVRSSFVNNPPKTFRVHVSDDDCHFERQLTLSAFSLTFRMFSIPSSNKYLRFCIDGGCATVRPGDRGDTPAMSPRSSLIVIIIINHRWGCCGRLVGTVSGVRHRHLFFETTIPCSCPKQKKDCER
jgi:hypothetical protein